MPVPTWLKTAGTIAKNLLPVGQAFGESALSVQQARKQREHEMQLQELAYDRNVDLWERQMDYNSPKNQMERFREAGLNPNLMYGKGDAGNIATLPKYQAPRANYTAKFPNIMGALQSYQNLEIQQQQSNMLKAQRDYIIQKTATESWNTQIFGQKWNKGEIDLGNLTGTDSPYENQLRATLNLTNKRREEAEQRITNLVEQAEGLKLSNQQMRIANKWKKNGLEGEDILYKLIFLHMEDSAMDWKDVALGVRAGQELLGILNNFNFMGLIGKLTGKGSQKGTPAKK